METNYAIEMLNITKRFPGIIANDNITLRLKKGEIHALLGENGAGKSTLMSVLFGLYQPEEGEIHKDGRKVEIRDPNDANELGIGMVHQHFKLVECFSVLDNIILGVEPNKMGFLQKQDARKKVLDLSEKYGLHVDPDAIIEDITVGMQQRTEILKMLYRDNEILIFDEPTAVLTPQEIEELMQIMKNLAAEGKSILFISHKLNEIMEVSDRVTVLRKGKCIGTVETANTTAEELSAMMVGRNVSFHVEKGPLKPGGEVLSVEHLTVASKVHKNNAVKDVSFRVRAGEIVCIAGIDGNGQTELVYALTGLEPAVSGKITLEGKDITHASIRQRSLMGMSHIPEDRHKHGLVLDTTKFGYELKATGLNKNAAKYCGMAEKRNIILSLMISGALAGMGAAMLYLTSYEQWQCSSSSVPAMGFNGIAAAFLGGLNPIGSIFASFFIQHITAGGAYVDKSMYCAQISDLISALIIYLCGFVLFMKNVMSSIAARREEKAIAKAKALAEAKKGGETE